MASVVRIFQGSGKNILVNHNESAIVSADEIEWIVDTVPTVKKSLSASEIVGVTASSFTVAITKDDFATIKAGEYHAEVRYTPSGSTDPVHGRLNPSQVKVIDSAFV